MHKNANGELGQSAIVFFISHPYKTTTSQINLNEKNKKKLTPAQKAAKKKRQQEYMTVFMNGKQKRVKRPPTIDGMDVDEFIMNNADPIFLHQNELWEYMDLPKDYIE